MHPDRVGPYLIQRRIGSGGMGNVYLGVHETTDDHVAVKVLPASMAREEGFVLRFSREIEALRKLSHRNIVRIYEDGSTPDGSYFYSMEYVDGETLTALISREKRLPWKRVIEISQQIASALKAAHDAGIVHRDLKPSNLMVDRSGNIRLADFGVAHVFASTRLTRTGGVVGTAEYMSPEQARGVRADKRSDLYSLGAVMYVMLTGRPPFTGKLASDILHQHQFGQFDRPSHYVPDLPRQLEEVVCTLLEKKPDKRFPDALVLLRKLENVLGVEEYREKNAATVSGLSASDRTSGAASDRTQDSGAGGQSRGPGPATMVRDLIRQDIDARHQKSALGRFFDNFWVLSALLVLVVAAGIYLSRRSVPTDRQRFAEAERVMNAPASTAWLRVRNEIIEPLLESDTLPDERSQLELWASQVDQFEFCRGLKSSAPTDGSVQSELQRLIRRAFTQYGQGDVVQAREQLEAVFTIISGDSRYEYLANFVQWTLTDWAGAQNEQARSLLLSELLERAEADGKVPGAQVVSTLRSALKLYADDPVVSGELARIRQLLESAGSTTPEALPELQQ
ncbi:MAG: serine/threonine-protein kinase [Planctomycetaceae bacterium]